MIKTLHNIHPIVFLLIATTFEVSGDAIIRMCIYNHTGMAGIDFGLIGMILLFGLWLLSKFSPCRIRADRSPLHRSPSRGLEGNTLFCF